MTRIRLAQILEEEGLQTKDIYREYWERLVQSFPQAQPIASHGNEIESYSGKYKDAQVKISSFREHFNVKMAWGMFFT